jgi:hypothetical protein
VNEAKFATAYLKRWKAANPGSVWHRIPDGIQGYVPDGSPVSSPNPFDHFGIIAPSGQAIAWEFKFMKGGVTFVVNTQFKRREHQIYRLRDWAAAGGIAMVVLGWIPHKARRTITFEYPISRIKQGGRIPLTRPAK